MSWISEVQNTIESTSDGLQLPEKQTAPTGPKQDLPDRLSGGVRIYKLEKIVAGGKGIKEYPAQQWKCVLHVRSKVKLDTFVTLHCSASQRLLF